MLLDNGRTRVLADEVGRQALHCIRCSACLNVCPVYSRTGGHAYGSVYPGPDRRDPHAAAARDREREVAAVRVEPLRRLLRGVPGQDRHPAGAAAPARRGAGRGARRSERRCARSPACSAASGCTRGRSASPASAARRPPGSWAAGAMDSHTRSPSRREGDFPRRGGGVNAAREEILARVRASTRRGTCRRPRTTGAAAREPRPSG